jgi:flagellar hook-basal body complex protein FliE
MIDRMDINSLLTQMRSMKAQTQAFARPDSLANGDVAAINGLHGGVKIAPQDQLPSFGDMLAQAVNKVNSVQNASSAMATAYEKGDPTVDISDVMVASQKASVAFQSMVQVRNKVIDAYRDIMNMPL